MKTFVPAALIALAVAAVATGLGTASPGRATTTVSASTVFAAHGATTATARCPNGYFATRGGFTIPDQVNVDRLDVDGLTSARAWTVRLHATVGAGTELPKLRVSATCMRR